MHHWLVRSVENLVTVVTLYNNNNQSNYLIKLQQKHFSSSCKLSNATVLQDGQFAALRNKYWSLIFFSSNFDDFLQPKSPILWIFDHFSNRNGQNGEFLGLKIA